MREIGAGGNADPRRPGRPRSPAADAAIRAAAWALLAEEGSRRMSLKRVAARAGVAVTTVYRRFSDVDDLVLALQEEVYDNVPVPDTGSVRGDLIEMMSVIVDVWSPPDRRRGLLVALVAAQADNPRVATAYAAQLAERRRLTTEILRRGVTRGEVEATPDHELVMEMLAGFVAQRLILSRRPLSRADVVAVVDVVLDGVVKRPGSSSSPS